MKIARYIFLAVGLLALLWGIFWPQQEMEMYLLNNITSIAGLAMIYCGVLIFRDQK